MGHEVLIAVCHVSGSEGIYFVIYSFASVGRKPRPTYRMEDHITYFIC
jgi:hypothetical protein